MVKNVGKSVLAVVALGMLSVSTEIAWSAENPSPGETAARAISKRNAFNLTSEPPPTRETAPPEPPRSEDIMLTGIYLHKGVERAALARVDTKKKAEPPTYLQLEAGEKKDGIEIVSITGMSRSGTSFTHLAIYAAFGKADLYRDMMGFRMQKNHLLSLHEPRIFMNAKGIGRQLLRVKVGQIVENQKEFFIPSEKGPLVVIKHPGLDDLHPTLF